MAAPTTRTQESGSSASQAAERAGREYKDSHETKPGFMTSEFISSIIAALGVLIAASVSEGFSAEEAWRLVSFLSIGYMISRGLAKLGVGRHSNR